MQVHTVTVVGAGTMGSGIAQICAQKGWQTRLCDAFPESLEKGMENIERFWDKGIEKGKTTKQEKEEWSKNLEFCIDITEAVDGADLVIEAVPEILELKKEIFIQLEEIAPKNAILATNTSSISISSIANVTSCPERIIGMHFFNPVPIMKLLEIVKHEKSGLLAEVKDAKELANHVERILNGSIDKSKIIAEQQEILKKFSKSVTAEKTLQEYLLIR